MLTPNAKPLVHCPLCGGHFLLGLLEREPNA